MLAKHDDSARESLAADLHAATIADAGLHGSPGDRFSIVTDDKDAAFPIAKVDELEKMLRKASVKFEFHRYNAKHAFANETADSKNLPILKYDPKAAELAWRRTMDFFAKHLK